MINWLNGRLDLAENFLNKINKLENTNLARLWQRTSDEQKGSREKPVQFLWNANPYLDVLNKELNSEDNWFNQVEVEFVQRSVRRKSLNTRRNWGVAIIVILGLSTGLVFSLIGQKDALIGQIQASQQAAEANFELGQELNALLASLRAAKSLQDWPGYLFLFKPDSQLQTEVLQTLRKVFYSTREYNRREVPQGFKKMFFKPDGTLIIATAEDGTVRLQDFKGTPLPKIFSGHEGDVDLDVSPDSRLLATTDKQGTFRLWNLEGKQEEPRQLTDCISGFTDTDIGLFLTDGVYIGVYNRGISFSPDSKKLLAYLQKRTKKGNSSTICLWETGDQPKLLKREVNFSSISFNSKNQLVVANESGDTLRLSDYRSRNQLAEFKNFNQAPSGYLAFSPTLSGNLVFSPISPNGEYLAGLFGDDVSIAYFRSLDSEYWKEFKPISRASSIIFDTEGRLIIGQEGEGIISVYDEPYKINDSLSDALEFELKGHQGGIREVISSSSKGRQIASLGDDNTLVWWKLDQKPLEELELIPNLKSISISPDGKQLAVVGSDDTIRLLDLKGKELKRFPDLKTTIRQIIFSPDGTQLAGVGQENRIRLLDLNGNELYKSKNFNKTISQLLFSPDGTQLLVVENDSTVYPQGYDDNKTSTLHRLNLNSKIWKTEPKLWGEIAFSSDGKLLVAQNAFEDHWVERGNIFLKELESGEELVKFKSANRSFDSIGFSTQGGLVVSAERHYEEKDYTYVWHMSGKLLTAFDDGHQSKVNESTVDESTVTSISFSADGSVLATLDSSGTAKLWRIGGLNDLIAKGCDWVRDYLSNPNLDESDRNLCKNVPPL
ncbi:MAG: WD40 repeat domain-containing protein [Moorea sp. SIO3A5]|nr:WD40 repeat domain-containing protein [Moorena sp. SIO3A5]